MDCLKEGVGKAVDLITQSVTDTCEDVKARRTLNSRSRRSLPAVSRTGTVGEGWNLTELTSLSERAA